MDGKFSIHFREKITLEMTAVQWSLKKANSLVSL